MKKLLAAIIAAALLLSGCSLSSRPAVSAPPAETPSPSPTATVQPTLMPQPTVSATQKPLATAIPSTPKPTARPTLSPSWKINRILSGNPLLKRRGLLFFASFAIIARQPMRTVRNHPVLKQNYGPKARCAFQAAQGRFFVAKYGRVRLPCRFAG